MIQVNISQKDYERYKLSGQVIDFDVLLKRIHLELAKEALHRCQELAEEAGISNMTLDEINYEIQQVRNAKNRS